jgi:hypothetical protein
MLQWETQDASRIVGALRRGERRGEDNGDREQGRVQHAPAKSRVACFVGLDHRFLTSSLIRVRLRAVATSTAAEPETAVEM